MVLTKPGAGAEGLGARLRRGWGEVNVRFQKPFSLLSRGLGPRPSMIKVALNKAWHIQGEGKGRGQP